MWDIQKDIVVNERVNAICRSTQLDKNLDWHLIKEKSGYVVERNFNERSDDKPSIELMLACSNTKKTLQTWHSSNATASEDNTN